MKKENIEILLKDNGEVLNLKPKSKIIKPDEFNKNFFFIKSGILYQYYIVKGKKHVFRLIEPNDFCESITILRGDKNNFEYIETITEVSLIKFDYNKLIKIMNNNLELSNFFREILEDFLYFQEIRIQKFLSLSPMERYQDFVRENYEKFGKFSDNIIASYLGMTKESLSRFRNRKS
ncbi:Crp/Fnr family transcriptional regulator [Leptospira sp. WS58.C1]|uniref:Crp/Fnr family transcriptional regulator n=1 Tax=Leptospira cinconiae TaxID=3235173 RepID=UPI00349EBB6B